MDSNQFMENGDIGEVEIYIRDSLKRLRIEIDEKFPTYSGVSFAYCLASFIAAVIVIEVEDDITKARVMKYLGGLFYRIGQNIAKGKPFDA